MIKTNARELTDDESDLELLDTVNDGDELAGTPDETLHLNAAHRLLKFGHVGLVIPGLHLEGDDRLKRRKKLSKVHEAIAEP